MLPSAPLPLSPGRTRTRWLVVLALVVSAGAAFGASWFFSSHYQILSRTSAGLLDQVEERAAKADAPPDLGMAHSPVVVWVSAALVGEAEVATSTVRSLDGLAGALLAASLLLFASLLVGPLWAMVALLLFALQPQVLQRFMEVGSLTNLAALLVPALLLGIGLTRPLFWTRLAILAVAGLLGGVAVFVHHLGLWTMVGATLALFVALRPRIERGQIVLAPIGFELAAVLAAFVLAAALTYKLSGMEGKAAIGYLFGPFKPFHPAFAVAGTVYREVSDGGPPLWTTVYLWLGRIPLSLWALAGLGGAVAFGHIGRATTPPGLRTPALLFVPAGALTALLIVATGAGSPQYSGTVNLLAALALWPTLLATIGCATWLAGTDGWHRYAGAALALLLVGHLALVDARHLPHPSSYANVLAGGSGPALAGGNSLYAEPTIDVAAARALSELGDKVVVAPRWQGARSVLNRFALELERKPLALRSGGALPALILGGIAAPEAGAFIEYCNGPEVEASLTVDGQVVWCVISPGVLP